MTSWDQSLISLFRLYSVELEWFVTQWWRMSSTHPWARRRYRLWIQIHVEKCVAWARHPLYQLLAEVDLADGVRIVQAKYVGISNCSFTMYECSSCKLHNRADSSSTRRLPLCIEFANEEIKTRLDNKPTDEVNEGFPGSKKELEQIRVSINVYDLNKVNF